MEALLWAFIGFAVIFVGVASTVLFVIAKKVLLKNHTLSRLQKLGIFTACILVSCAAGVLVMVIFDIR